MLKADQNDFKPSKVAKYQVYDRLHLQLTAAANRLAIKEENINTKILSIQRVECVTGS